MEMNVRRQTADVRRETSIGSEGVELPTRGSGVQHPRSQWFTHYASRITYCLLLIAACILATGGCENSFEPYEENDTYNFTIYGYLNASADTQFVRVEPARQEFDIPAEVPDIRVTLEELDSGETVVMNDSLDSIGGFNFVNYWTTTAIEHGLTYLLRAEHADGRSSEVMVTVPDELPTPRVRTETSPIAPTTYTVYVDDTVPNLVDVQSRYYVRIFSPNFEARKLFAFSYREDAEIIEAYGGSYSIFIEPTKEMEQIVAQSQALLPPDGEIEVLHRQIYVAAGGPEWNPEIASMSELVYAVPGNFSNVENGLGYMIGIDSKIVPFVSCFDSMDRLIPCEEEEAYW